MMHEIGPQVVRPMSEVQRRKRRVQISGIDILAQSTFRNEMDFQTRFRQGLYTRPPNFRYLVLARPEAK